MKAIISLSKSALVRLISSFYPNPDDPGNPHNPFGPYGPIGPVIDKWLWVLLNPQPLPPGPDPYRFNPQPDPWRIAGMADSIVNTITSTYNFAGLLSEGDNQSILSKIGKQVNRLIDDYCGTPPHFPPRPWPQFDAAKFRPVDYLIFGARFQQAGESFENDQMQSILFNAADKFFETGLKKLENS